MSKDPIIKYATGYYKGKLSIVTLERESRFSWWVRIESKPYITHCDLFTFYFFANKRFWKLVDTYDLKAFAFSEFDIDKEDVLKKLKGGIVDPKVKS